jgi:hypothetical protein
VALDDILRYFTEVISVDNKAWVNERMYFGCELSIKASLKTEL